MKEARSGGAHQIERLGPLYKYETIRTEMYKYTTKYTLAVFSSIEKCNMKKKRFPVTSNLRYMNGVLNVDKIKN
jgi:hypothetical protein